jgi:hypothetical protein
MRSRVEVPENHPQDATVIMPTNTHHNTGGMTATSGEAPHREVSSHVTGPLDEHDEDDVVGGGSEQETICGCERTDCSGCSDASSQESTEDAPCICVDCQGAAAWESNQKPENDHATNCWDQSCNQCSTRGAGVELWDARDESDCKDPYTSGVTAMGKSYVAGRNIVVMVPDQETIQLMKSCVRAGRKFRKLKTDSKVTMDETRTKMKQGREDMERLQAWIGAIDSAIKLQGETPKLELIQDRAQGRQDYLNASAKYTEMRQILEALTLRLKEQEKVWINSMRELNDIHSATLVDCGLLQNDNVPIWDDEEYEIESVESAPEMQVFEEISRAPVEETGRLHFGTKDDKNGEKKTAPTQPVLEPEEIERRRKHKELEEALTRARRAHKQHRSRHGKLLREYIDAQEDDREISHDEQATGFAPIFLTQWRQLTQDYQAAEDALAAFELEEWKKACHSEGKPLHLSCDHDCVEDHNKAIAAEGNVRCDRERIEHWMEADMDPVKIAETVVDEFEGRVGIRQNEEKRIVQKPARVGNNGAIQEEAAAEEEVAAESEAAGGEEAPAVEETEDAPPAKTSRKRKAAARIEPNQSKKRVYKSAAPSEEPEEQVNHVQKRYNLRTRKAPEPEPPTKRAPKKKATKGKEAREVIVVADEDVDEQPEARTAKKKKTKERTAPESPSFPGPIASKSKKRLRSENSKEVAPPVVSKRARSNNNENLDDDADDEINEANSYANDARDGSSSPLHNLRPTPVYAPMPLGRALRVGDLYGEEPGVSWTDPEYRFKTELWCKKVRKGYL